MKGRKSDTGLVYFMRRADGVGPIKIGCSKWPEQRLQQLQVWSPEPLQIVARAQGTFADETRLHREFAAFRLHAEWFEASPEVLSCLARVVATGELPPPRPDDRNLQIMARYDAGDTLQAIADDLSVTRQRVEQIVRKCGGAPRGHVGRKRAPVWSKIEEVRSLAQAGCTVDEIADAVGDARQNVYVAGRQLGIKFRKSKRKVSDRIARQAFDVAADYKAGIKTAVIAEKYGIPQPSIYRLLGLAGVKPTRLPHTINSLPIDEIAAAYRKGATLVELADRFDRRTTTLKRRLEAHGVTLRTREQNEAIRIDRVSRANRLRWAA